MKKIQSLCLGLSLFAFPLTAHADAALQDEINQIKDDIVVIQRKLYRERSDTSAPQESVSSVQMRLGGYDQMIRDMNGKVENIEYRLRNIEKKLEVFDKDLDLRFEQLKKQVVIPTESAPKNDKKVKKQNKKAKNTTNKKKTSLTDAKNLYEKALKELKNNNLDEAKNDLNEFLDEYPDNILAANAQYWLGEVYYKQQKFSQAAVAFKDGYSKYPDGVKGPDCLLKLGLSMKALNKNKEACTAFVNLPTIFGKVNPDIAARAKKEAEALSCK